MARDSGVFDCAISSHINNPPTKTFDIYYDIEVDDLAMLEHPNYWIYKQGQAHYRIDGREVDKEQFSLEYWVESLGKPGSPNYGRC